MLTLTLFDLFSHIAVYQMDTGETIVERLYISTRYMQNTFMYD